MRFLSPLLIFIVVLGIASYTGSLILAQTSSANTVYLPIISKRPYVFSGSVFDNGTLAEDISVELLRCEALRVTVCRSIATTKTNGKGVYGFSSEDVLLDGNATTTTYKVKYIDDTLVHLDRLGYWETNAVKYNSETTTELLPFDIGFTAIVPTFGQVLPQFSNTTTVTLSFDWNVTLVEQEMAQQLVLGLVYEPSVVTTGDLFFGSNNQLSDTEYTTVFLYGIDSCLSCATIRLGATETYVWQVRIGDLAGNRGWGLSKAYRFSLPQR